MGVGRQAGDTGESGRARVWRPGWPCPVGQLLLPHRRGAGDPTFRVERAGSAQARFWRAIRTPAGSATLRIEARVSDGEVRARAWGDGADWALDSVPAVLGADDDPSGFDPRHPVLAEVLRHHPHWRLGRTDRVMESLVPSIIEQKVTGQEAFAGFARLVRRFGEPAPGPVADLRLMLQPAPDTLRQVPSWEWLRMHIDPARSRTVVQAARVADALERSVGRPMDEVDRRLRTLPGVGVWTSAEVRQRAFGDADAVSFGDYHVAKDIGWALTGQPFDDEQLAAYLEPWRPHRGRVQALVALARLGAPRRGPRMAPRTHLPAPRRPG